MQTFIGFNPNRPISFNVRVFNIIKKRGPENKVLLVVEGREDPKPVSLDGR